MNQERPFSGPTSVSLAAVTLLGLAAWSFTSGLNRELRAPRGAPTGARVIVLPARPAAVQPIGSSLAYMAALAPEPTPASAAPAPKQHRRTRATAPIAPPASPAPQLAIDAAGASVEASTVATAPAEPPPQESAPAAAP